MRKLLGLNIEKRKNHKNGYVVCGSDGTRGAFSCLRAESSRVDSNGAKSSQKGFRRVASLRSDCYSALAFKCGVWCGAVGEVHVQ